MATTPTDRIFALLPPTFLRNVQGSVLHALLDAIGAGIGAATDLLPSVRRAHQFPRADAGRPIPRDLVYLAAFHGIEPEPGEETEDFRNRLRELISLRFDGASTVGGILRLAALTLRLPGDTTRMRRPREVRVRQPDDATETLLGVRWVSARGVDAYAATLLGSPLPLGGADLADHRRLRLIVGDLDRIVEFAPPGVTSALVDAIAAAAKINAAFPQYPGLAVPEGLRLRLEAPMPGAASRLEVVELPKDDAAGPLLGIAPRTVRGAAALPARLLGTVDLQAGVDLSATPYLRLRLDDDVREVDCATLAPGPGFLDGLCSLINVAFAEKVAAHDGHFLGISAPQVGADHTVEIQAATSQDAAPILFGPFVPAIAQGVDARPAILRGTPLPAVLDLRSRRFLSLRVNGRAVVQTIDCAGATPEATTRAELRDRINQAHGLTAEVDGAGLVLTVAGGAESILEVDSAGAADAAEVLLGLRPRVAVGADAGHARVVADRHLPATLNLGVARILTVALDGQPPKRIDVAGPIASATTPAEVVDAINGEFSWADHPVAALVDGRVELSSPTTGAASRVALVSRDLLDDRRFLTELPFRDEAGEVLFGFPEGEAEAKPARQAILVGQIDLRSLAEIPSPGGLRVEVGQEVVDVDFGAAGQRTGAAERVVEALNTALGTRALADLDGQGHLRLATRDTGPDACLKVVPSKATDAAELLLGFDRADAQGAAATRVRFIGVRPHEVPIEPGNRTLLRIGVDGAGPIDLDLSPLLQNPAVPGKILPGELIDWLNNVFDIQLGAGEPIAEAEGPFLTLRARETGNAGRILLDVPGDPARDATELLFGVLPPRDYKGAEARAAEIRGTRPVPALHDKLKVRRHLRLALDERPPRDIDFARDPQNIPKTLGEVVEAINDAISEDVASDEAGTLVLRSTIVGLGSRVAIEPSTAADASGVLWGPPSEGAGTAAEPAVLTGERSLLGLLDLRRHGTIRLSVDDGPPRDVRVAGEDPTSTQASRVVDALNAALPRPDGLQMAALDDQGRLRLVAERRIQLLPARALTLAEFPPTPNATADISVRYCHTWTVDNAGVTGATAQIILTSGLGTDRPKITNLTTGATVWFRGVLAPGAILRLQVSPEGYPRGTLDGREIPADALAPDCWDSVLSLPAGRSNWLFTDCLSGRFGASLEDQVASRFDADHFTGGPNCRAEGLFDRGEFADSSSISGAVFGPVGPAEDIAKVRLEWAERRPGRFVLELPADLTLAWGGRFDDARWAGATAPTPVFFGEEPPDPALLFKGEVLLADWARDHADLVSVALDDPPSPGPAVKIAPWDDPVQFAGGTRDEAARLVVTYGERTRYLRFQACGPGMWGNCLALTVASGPGPETFTLTLHYSGAPFDSARERVQAALAKERAAGIEAIVVRAGEVPALGTEALLSN